MTRAEAETPRVATPSFADLERAVEEILPLAQEDADEAERLYHLTDRVWTSFAAGVSTW